MIRVDYVDRTFIITETDYYLRVLLKVLIILIDLNRSEQKACFSLVDKKGARQLLIVFSESSCGEITSTIVKDSVTPLYDFETRHESKAMHGSKKIDV